jgi:lipopolysaccharide transport system permease protein
MPRGLLFWLMKDMQNIERREALIRLKPKAAHMERGTDVSLHEIGRGVPVLKAPIEHIQLLREYRFLISNLVRKEIRGRYKNALLGNAWTVIEPALLAVVYYFLFALISGNEDVLYAVWVLIGVVIWSCFGKTLQSTVGALTRNASMIQLVHFPRAVFPLTVMIANIVLSMLSCIVFIPLIFIFDVEISWRLVFIPVSVLLASMQAIGLGMCLAPYNCVQQDVEHTIRFVVRAGFFLSPVMWTWEMAVQRGGVYADVVLLNPMVLPITLARHGFEGQNLGMGSFAVVLSAVWIVGTWIVGNMVFAAKERGAVKHL